jgi:hypothetical protein
MQRHAFDGRYKIVRNHIIEEYFDNVSFSPQTVIAKVILSRSLNIAPEYNRDKLGIQATSKSYSPSYPRGYPRVDEPMTDDLSWVS